MISYSYIYLYTSYTYIEQVSLQIKLVENNIQNFETIIKANEDKISQLQAVMQNDSSDNNNSDSNSNSNDNNKQQQLEETNSKLTTELAQLELLFDEERLKCIAEEQLLQTRQIELKSLQSMNEYHDLLEEKKELTMKIKELDIIFQKECDEKAKNFESTKLELTTKLKLAQAKKSGSSTPRSTTKSTSLLQQADDSDDIITKIETPKAIKDQLSPPASTSDMDNKQDPNPCSDMLLPKESSVYTPTTATAQSSIPLVSTPASTIAPILSSNTSKDHGKTRAKKASRMGPLGLGYVGGSRKVTSSISESATTSKQSNRKSTSQRKKDFLDSDSDHDEDPYSLPINSSKHLAKKLSQQSHQSLSSQSQSNFSKKRLLRKTTLNS